MKQTVAITATATIEVEYGEYRRAVAAWAGKHPADVVAGDVDSYELVKDYEEGWK